MKKRLFLPITVTLVFLVILLTISTHAHTFARTCPLKPQNSHSSVATQAVYYITTNCTKRPFLNPTVFFTYFDSWADVNLTTPTKLTQIPTDNLGFMPFGPKYDPQYGALVKTINDPKVYLLLNDKKYWITKENVFNALNYKWGWVEDVDARLLDKYTTGGEISQTTHHPNFTLIKYKNDPRVYQLQPDPQHPDRQVKKHIEDEEEFQQSGFRWDRIVELDSSETYPDVEQSTSTGQQKEQAAGKIWQREAISSCVPWDTCSAHTYKPLKPIAASPINLTYCTEENGIDCCGNGRWESHNESPVTCRQDVEAYFEQKGRSIVHVAGDDQVNVTCIEPCPFSADVVEAYYEKYKDWYWKVVDFVGFFPPSFDNTNGNYRFSSYSYAPLTILLGDANTKTAKYHLNPASAGANVVKKGCPTGLCVPGDAYIYYQDMDSILKERDFRGTIIAESENPRSEVHESLHNFLPASQICRDWNHGLVMFLDNIITRDSPLYSQFEDEIDYIHSAKVPIYNLPEERLRGLKDSIGTDYARGVGYIFMTGLYNYYGCDNACAHNIVTDIIKKKKTSTDACSGKNLRAIIEENTQEDVQKWISLMGLDSKDHIDIFKQRLQAL